MFNFHTPADITSGRLRQRRATLHTVGLSLSLTLCLSVCVFGLLVVPCCAAIHSQFTIKLNQCQMADYEHLSVKVKSAPNWGTEGHKLPRT